MRTLEAFITRVVELGGTVTFTASDSPLGGPIKVHAVARCDGVERHVQVRCSRLDYLGETFAFREADEESCAGIANVFWQAKLPDATTAA